MSGEGGAAPSAPGGAAPGAPSAGGEGGGETAAPSTPEARDWVTPDEIGAFVGKRKVRVKADGKDQDVDWAEGSGYLSLGKAAHRRIEESTKATRQAQEMYQLARRVLDSPEDVLDGMSDEQADAWLGRLAKRLKEKALPQDQRKALEEARELEALRKERKEREEHEQRQQQTQAQAALSQRYQRAFAGAMDQAGLSKDPGYRTQMMGVMAGLARQALARGQHDMTIPELLAQARESVRAPMRETVRGSKPEELEEMLGDETVAKLVARHLKKQRAQEVVPSAPPNGTPNVRGPDAKPAPQIQHVGDYSAYLDSLEKKPRR